MVVSPYQAQCLEIRKALQQRGEKAISVASVREAQGKDQRLVSMVTADQHNVTTGGRHGRGPVVQGLIVLLAVFEHTFIMSCFEREKENHY